MLKALKILEFHNIGPVPIPPLEGEYDIGLHILGLPRDRCLRGGVDKAWMCWPACVQRPLHCAWEVVMTRATSQGLPFVPLPGPQSASQWLSGEESACQQVLSLGQEDALEKGNGNPLQDSCLENSMDRGAWQATIHGVAKSQIQLNN